MKCFYQGAVTECEFCHRKFKEDELVLVADTSRIVFCFRGDGIRDQALCAHGFGQKNPGFVERATVMIYRGGACSCVTHYVDKSKKNAVE